MENEYDLLFLGTATTYLYLKTKNITSSILLHFLYNVFVVFLSFI
ncbi:type II CAAX prenyl endopeptidase Rce1 family protein [Enterococcus casseliflavus]|uniref:CPBP family intramembrane metalloprotease n=1 Tax=Enterococcus casseliflavus TaxID=37734 RepID=A0ABD6Z7L6_ENTCA|nr:CPBP family intramembrane metalloprotease [Enterococcus casseliflavus]MCD5160435.1 CPBP family intramembrane metalloprotease [Enterococcus casseliflavus]MCD5190083.1 CPBP family intramembrane metalloprotease [Enterococcus casseliflavus]QGN31073.1 CPBP family intramembrane metalloprotease [Enterococcus casseliflavus]QQB86481.1 CPBP family intramembrane metalloprotease [Enterococcus casseliflavus]